MVKQEESRMNCIVVDGVAYVAQKEALRMTGLTRPSFCNRVSHYGIQEFRRNSRRVMYRVADIEEGIKNGWFLKWYM